jgi:DNA-binding beta-propeller fold protein YncE
MPARVRPQNPQMITIAPDGTSAYVTGGTTIWQYSINPATGRVTPKSPATVAAGRNPHDLAVAPDGSVPAPRRHDASVPHL